MKTFAILCIFLATSWTAIGEQEMHDVTLKEIHRKTFPSGRIRYEYVFLANNDTRHRLNLIINVALLDASKKIIDNRFLSFDTRAGMMSTGSVEFDYGPPGSRKEGPTASFYKLYIRNESHRRSYEKEGNLAVPLIQQKG
jgi:hypothetical protein